MSYFFLNSNFQEKHVLFASVIVKTDPVGMEEPVKRILVVSNAIALLVSIYTFYVIATLQEFCLYCEIYRVSYLNY